MSGYFMKINKYLLGMVSFIAFSSLYLQAATLDYRHEYALLEPELIKNRIAIIETS